VFCGSKGAMFVIDKNLLSYLEKDFTKFSDISDDVRQENRKRIFTGGVRINNAMYRTKIEDDMYRKKVLNTELP
jgi:hypothetical protein